MSSQVLIRKGFKFKINWHKMLETSDRVRYKYIYTIKLNLLSKILSTSEKLILLKVST